MAGRKRTRSSRSRADASGLPDVYGEMLAEAGASAGPSTSSEPSPKRLKRPGEKKALPKPVKEPILDEEDEDEDIEFEDVALPAPTVQTMTRDSEDEESEEEEIEFEDIDFGALQPESETAQEPKKLTLNLSAHGPLTSTIRKGVDRRKPMTKEEKERRITIHRTHVLCLVHHSALRNRWCDDEKVRKSLKSLLTKKTIDYLNPGSHLTQFGRTESLKNGLQQAGSVFKAKFQITERGLRRPLWAEDPEHLAKYEPPSNMDSCIDRSQFREAARKLQGSRDVGAQLYCALLRAAGVRARLVCSLQALSFAPGGPSLPKPKVSAKAAKAEKTRAQLAQYKTSEEASSSDLSKASPLRRLGHPNAAAYQIPALPASPPAHRQPKETPIKIRESQYPVYWVEVLDVGHQKWQPVDPLVTHSMWKPRALEPPAVDRENCMSYVVAFDTDGTVRDVTRRYAKAYAAKTRKLRIESAVERGDRWWRKALKPFRRPVPTDLDQIEDNELQAVEAREPMPRNVADFKDHPVFALQRHLRRNEVLVPEAQPAGTVAAGSKAPLEKVYRRKDVRIARSRDKWYRAFGREVKPMEIPVKFLPRRANAKPGEYVDDGYGGDERDATGTPIFMEEQTELYRAPAVVNGRIPKNKFGNIDLYVPTMVPEGGVHIADEFDTAARAAYILGIDYAPALGGFQFKGRHGTAVMNGVVVACGHEEAVRAVMDGLQDMDAQTEQSKRSLAAVRMWRRFLTALRIRERVYAGVDPDERAEEERQVVGALGETTEDHDMSEGRGFIHDDADIAAGGGGFIPDDADSAAVGGGFLTGQYDGTSEGAAGYVASERGDDVVGGRFLAGEDDDASGGGFVPGADDAKDGTEDMGVIDEDEVASKGDDGKPAVDGAAASASELERDDEEMEDEASDVTEEYDMEEDEGGGGFLVE